MVPIDFKSSWAWGKRENARSMDRENIYNEKDGSLVRVGLSRI